MSSQHHSFLLSRAGLKAGYYVPLRLRIVDTLTVLSGLPIYIAAIVFVMSSFRWIDQFGLGVIWRNPLAFLAYIIVVMFIAAWTVYLTSIAILRFMFRMIGMMTATEAKYYPLRADKKCFDPWPDAWQKPYGRCDMQCATEPTDEREPE